MRRASLCCIACMTIFVCAGSAGAGEAWTLDSRTGDRGKSCSLARTEGNRPLSITLAFLPDTTERGVVSLAFDEPKLLQGAKKALATVQFDNGKKKHHRLEVTEDGTLLVPMVTSKVQNDLQTISESSKLTVATRHGSTSFSLDGIATHIGDLRDCAAS